MKKVKIFNLENLKNKHKLLFVIYDDDIIGMLITLLHEYEKLMTLKHKILTFRAWDIGNPNGSFGNSWGNTDLEADIC